MATKNTTKTAVPKKKAEPRRRGFHSVISETFAVLRPGSQFLVIKRYRPREGGVFDYTMAFRSDYHRVCVESVKVLETMNFTEQWAKVTEPNGPFNGKVPFTYGDFERAFIEVIDSMRKSCAGLNEKGEAIREAYSLVRDANKEPVKGVKYHKASRTLHVEGIMVRSTMIEDPPKKSPVNSKPLTLAKNFLRDQLPIAYWRQWRLTEGAFEALKIESLTLTAEESRALLV